MRPNWIALQECLRLYHANPTDTQARDLAFAHVHVALEFISRQVVLESLAKSAGSVTEISENLVKNVYAKKTFTEFANKYDSRIAKFRTWVTKILNNEFVNWTRKLENKVVKIPIEPGLRDEIEGEWNTLIIEISELGPNIEHPPGPLTQLIGKEDKARVQAALKSLPMRFREVLLVDDYEETQEQAALRLGIGLATFKRRKTLGTRALKATLE